MPVLMVRGADKLNEQTLTRLRRMLKDALANFKPLGLEGPHDVEVYFPKDLLGTQDELCITIMEMWKKEGRDKKMQDRLCTGIVEIVQIATGDNRRIFCYADPLFDQDGQGHYLIEVGG